MSESGPAGIEVVRIFGPNLVCSPVKGDYHVWSDTGSIRHGAVVCRIVNWKGLNAYSVTSPLNIWTKFGVWLPRTLGDPPSKGKNFVESIIYFIAWTAKGGGGVVRIVI